MPAYYEITEDIKNIVRPYIKRGETLKISGNIEFNGKLYREIIIYKKGFSFFGKEAVGYMYISSNNSIVTSSNVLLELSKLGHYYEVFLSEEKKKGIIASLESKDDVASDRLEMEDIVNGLDFLRDEGIEGTDKIKYVVKSLPDVKSHMDRRIEYLKEKIEDLKKSNRPFSEETIKELYPIYEEILRINFDNVKLIGSLYEVCDTVQTAAEKKRKKWKIRVKKNVVGRLMKVSDKIAYFKKIIRTYSNVINLTPAQYVKFLKDINKEKIESRYSLVRGLK